MAYYNNMIKDPLLQQFLGAQPFQGYSGSNLSFSEAPLIDVQGGQQQGSGTGLEGLFGEGGFISELSTSLGDDSGLVGQTLGAQSSLAPSPSIFDTTMKPFEGYTPQASAVNNSSQFLAGSNQAEEQMAKLQGGKGDLIKAAMNIFGFGG